MVAVSLDRRAGAAPHEVTGRRCTTADCSAIHREMPRETSPTRRSEGSPPRRSDTAAMRRAADGGPRRCNDGAARRVSTVAEAERHGSSLDQVFETARAIRTLTDGSREPAADAPGKAAGLTLEQFREFSSGSGNLVRTDMAARHRERLSRTMSRMTAITAEDSPRLNRHSSVRTLDQVCKKLSVHEALEKLEKLAARLQLTSKRLTKDDRTPLAEFEYILEQLDPVATGISEPFKRFEADVDSLAVQLKTRDEATVARLAAILKNIKEELDNGGYGTLPHPTPEADDPRGGYHFEEMFASETTMPNRDEVLELRLQSADAVDELTSAHEDRAAMQEEAMEELQTWFGTTVDDIIHFAGTDDEPGGGLAPGDSRAFASQEGRRCPSSCGRPLEPPCSTEGCCLRQAAFDVEMAIERGSRFVDDLVFSFQANADRVGELHSEMCNIYSERIRELEVDLAELQVSTKPDRDKLAAIHQEKVDLADRLAATERKVAEMNDANARVKKDLKKVAELHDSRASELRLSMQREKQAAETISSLQLKLQQLRVTEQKAEMLARDVEAARGEALRERTARESQDTQISELHNQLEEALAALSTVSEEAAGRASTIASRADESLRNQVASLEQRVRELNNRVAQRDERINAISQEKDEYYKEFMDELQAEVKSLKAAQAEAAAEAAARQAEQDMLASKMLLTDEQAEQISAQFEEMMRTGQTTLLSLVDSSMSGFEARCGAIGKRTKLLLRAAKPVRRASLRAAKSAGTALLPAKQPSSGSPASGEMSKAIVLEKQADALEASLKQKNKADRLEIRIEAAEKRATAAEIRADCAEGWRQSQERGLAKLLHSQAEGMRAEAATSDEAKLALKANAAQMRIEAAEMLKPRDSNPHEHQAQVLELKARFAEAEAKIASSDAEALRLRANAASLRSDAADLLANDEVDWLSAQLHADASELRASWAVLEAKAMEKEAEQGHGLNKQGRAELAGLRATAAQHRMRAALARAKVAEENERKELQAVAREHKARATEILADSAGDYEALARWADAALLRAAAASLRASITWAPDCAAGAPIWKAARMRADQDDLRAHAAEQQALSLQMQAQLEEVFGPTEEPELDDDETAAEDVVFARYKKAIFGMSLSSIRANSGDHELTRATALELMEKAHQRKADALNLRASALEARAEMGIAHGSAELNAKALELRAQAIDAKLAHDASLPLWTQAEERAQAAQLRAEAAELKSTLAPISLGVETMAEVEQLMAIASEYSVQAALLSPDGKRPPRGELVQLQVHATELRASAAEAKANLIAERKHLANVADSPGEEGSSLETEFSRQELILRAHAKQLRGEAMMLQLQEAPPEEAEAQRAAATEIFSDAAELWKASGISLPAGKQPSLDEISEELSARRNQKFKEAEEQAKAEAAQQAALMLSASTDELRRALEEATIKRSMAQSTADQLNNQLEENNFKCMQLEMQLKAQRVQVKSLHERLNESQRMAAKYAERAATSTAVDTKSEQQITEMKRDSLLIRHMCVTLADLLAEAKEKIRELETNHMRMKAAFALSLNFPCSFGEGIS
ncbi:hypothetical protein AB1Y20_002475 [Prymnesium parvum]|uniref:Uncharacterized protein n=1 Tax=Prymnesium parvum TaxID=97485 RepID=A0AB34JAI8_PRYPA